MTFAAPHWLSWGAVAVLGLLALGWLEGRAREAGWAAFARPELGRRLAPERDPRTWRRRGTLFLLGVAFCFVALARPRWGFREETSTAAGLDVMVVLDVSQSMSAEDLAPSRMAKAKHFLRELVAKLEGDRAGLVLFARSAYVMSPLTTDLGYLAENLQIVDTTYIKNQGTDVGAGLEIARQALERGSEAAADGTATADGAAPSHVVLLVSDGEDHEERALAEAEKLKAKGVKLLVVGVGTAEGGRMPIRDENGNVVGFKSDRSGKPLVTRFDPDALKGVAARGDGRYWTLSNAESPEVEAVSEALGGLQRGAIAERRYRVYTERFQIPLGLAWLCFFLECWIPRRRRLRAGAATAAAWALALVGSLATVGPPAHAGPVRDAEVYFNNRDGVREFKDGKTDEARQAFGKAQALDSDNPVLRFNQGAVELQGGDAPKAAQVFGDAAETARRRGAPGVEALAEFNRGAAAATAKQLDDGIGAYVRAIDAARRAGDAETEAAARRNLELLAQQREQQKKNDGKSENQDPKDGASDPQKNPGGSGEPKQPDEGKQAGKRFEDPSQSRKRYRGEQLSAEDVERVMAELTGREKELRGKLRKGKAREDSGGKDW